MKSAVDLSFNGSFEQGFSLTLYIKRDNLVFGNPQFGKLPPNLIIRNLYEQWWTSFVLLINYSRNWDDLEIDESLAENVRVQQATNKQQNINFCRNFWAKLQTEIKNWLTSSEADLSHIESALNREFALNPESRLLILADDDDLWKLPWFEWQILQIYDRVGISFSLPNLPNNSSLTQTQNSESLTNVINQKETQNLWRVIKSLPKYLENYFLNKKSVNILAVLGNDTCESNNSEEQKLQLENDKNEIQQLEGALPEFLDKPTSRNFMQKLRQRNDIFFFAGHSGNGEFQINQSEKLSINEFNHILKDAINNGLKIAIFNSCDGLKLGIDMLRINMPFSVVMQESIPDAVAYSFLNEFLSEYKNETSLHTSIRLAQQRLQDAELPGVQLLPTLIQIPQAIPPTYEELRKPFSIKNTPKLPEIFAVSLGLTILVFCLRWWGHLQSLELNAYDKFIQQQMIQKPDERVLVISVTPEDIKWLKQPPEETGQGARTLSDNTINNLLAKIEHFQPQIIGLNIFREGEISSQYSYFKSSVENGALITICTGNIDDKIEGIYAPNNALKENIGFADLALDQDYVIRRNILYINLENPQACQTKNALSFSFKLAENYLKKQGIMRTDTPKDNFIKLGDSIFPPLKIHQGGYHHQDDKYEIEGGIQIMLNYNNFNNYQRNIANNFTLQEVFEDKLISEDIQDKIVLIGKDFTSEDRSLTPFKKEIPNVFLHAQMVRNILDIVDEKKPVIWSLPWWVDSILIWFLSLQGGAIAFMFSILKFKLNTKNFLLLLTIVCASIYSSIYIVYWCLFTTQGLWLPLIPSYLAIFMTIIGILASRTIKKIQY